MSTLVARPLSPCSVLLELGRTFERLVSEWRPIHAAHMADPADVSMIDANEDLLAAIACLSDAVAELPANTLEEVAVKVRCILWDEGLWPLTHKDGADAPAYRLLSVAADLDRLTGPEPEPEAAAA